VEDLRLQRRDSVASRCRQPVYRSPSFVGHQPASIRSSMLASRSSKKHNTKCEVLLKRALKRAGLQFRTNDRKLPGVPDFVFEAFRLIVFVDGDFWHGRNLEARLSKLRAGCNPQYWTQKILSNASRDRRVARRLRGLGWSVHRVWESDVLKDAERVTHRILKGLSRQTVRCKSRRLPSSQPPPNPCGALS
jgi:DNA mismatch endonuclease, patch repair protein